MGKKITSTHMLECPMSELTAGDIKEFLQDVDDSAKVKVRAYHSDRPGEISTVMLEAEVDISKGRIY